MGLKTRLSAEERYALSAEHIYTAEAYLRKHKTAGVLDKSDAAPMYEMFIVGWSYEDIQKTYPHIKLGQLILTSAMSGWEKDKEKVQHSILDRIKTRIVRSTVEQVDMLTSFITVYNVETKQQIDRYLRDPANNPPPENRIQNMKDLQRTIEMLSEVTENVRLMTAPPKQDRKAIAASATESKLIDQPPKKTKPKDESSILAELVGDE